MTTSCRLPRRCPPWLQRALAEIEERVRDASLEAAAPPDTFGQRAESYYRKRPLLIALLRDLQKSYVYLADRYSRCKPIPSDVDAANVECSSDAESSLSFQFPQTASSGSKLGEVDFLVAELVTATVEKEMLILEVREQVEVMSESTRKIELQRSLLEVLESERMVLMGENARLGYRAQAAEEVAREMAADAAYMGRKAGEMAVVKLRGERSFCMLRGRIGGLQAQVHGLERRNRELLEAMAVGEEERAEVEAELERVRLENRRLRETAEGRRLMRRERWWGRVRKIDWVLCGPHVTGCKE